MKVKRARAFVGAVVMCLVFGTFAGCGHEQKTEVEYGKQSYREETNESRTTWQYESDADAESEINAEPDIAPKQEGSEISDADDHVGAKQQEQEMSTSNTQNTVTVNSEEVILESTVPEEEAPAPESSVPEEEMPEEKIPEEKMPAESVVDQESSMAEPELYFLTEQDKEAVMAQLIQLGESYGLTFDSNITEGETWDSPTPIYEEDMRLGREHVLRAMVEYSEGAFALMQLEGCEGFALAIKEKPNTVTDAYYEVYVYWV